MSMPRAGQAVTDDLGDTGHTDQNSHSTQGLWRCDVQFGELLESGMRNKMGSYCLRDSQE